MSDSRTVWQLVNKAKSSQGISESGIWRHCALAGCNWLIFQHFLAALSSPLSFQTQKQEEFSFWSLILAWVLADFSECWAIKGVSEFVKKVEIVVRPGSNQSLMRTINMIIWVSHPQHHKCWHTSQQAHYVNMCPNSHLSISLLVPRNNSYYSRWDPTIIFVYTNHSSQIKMSIQN